MAQTMYLMRWIRRRSVVFTGIDKSNRGQKFVLPSKSLLHCLCTTPKSDPPLALLFLRSDSSPILITELHSANRASTNHTYKRCHPNTCDNETGWEDTQGETRHIVWRWKPLCRCCDLFDGLADERGRIA